MVVGNMNINHHWQHNEITPVLNEKGFIEDFSKFDSYLTESLKLMQLKDKELESPFLFTEPCIHNKEHRQQLVEILFEKLNVPCCFIIKSGVLSAFSCGKSTCLVLDSAHNHTTAIPIHDGYMLQKSVQRVDYGGKTINKNIRELLSSK